MQLKLFGAFLIAISLSAQIGQNTLSIYPEGPREPGKVPAVKGASYSALAVFELTQTQADGSLITYRATSKLYRDSEGRERCEQFSEGSMKRIFISDPVENASYSLDHDNRIARRTIGQEDVEREMHGAIIRFVPGPMKAPEPPLPKGSVSLGAAHSEQLGTRTIEGLLAIGSRSIVNTPAGRIGNEEPWTFITERWISPDLHLAVLMTDNSPRRGDVTYKLTNIVRAEPAADLFKVPADYTVKSAYGVRMLEITRKQP